MRQPYYVGLLVLIVVILAVTVYFSTLDTIDGLWRAPESFVRKMGLHEDPKSRTSIGVNFTKDHMYVMIHSYGFMTVQRYVFTRVDEEVTMKFDRSTSEAPKSVSIAPLFIDGTAKINIHGKSLLLYDNKRVILHLIRA